MVDYARPNQPQASSKKAGNTVATAAIAQAQWSNVCCKHAIFQLKKLCGSIFLYNVHLDDLS